LLTRQLHNIPVIWGTVAKNFRRPQPQTITARVDPAIQRVQESLLTCSIWCVFWLNMTGSCENRVEVKANVTVVQTALTSIETRLHCISDLLYWPSVRCGKLSRHHVVWRDQQWPSSMNIYMNIYQISNWRSHRDKSFKSPLKYFVTYISEMLRFFIKFSAVWNVTTGHLITISSLKWNHLQNLIY